HKMQHAVRQLARQEGVRPAQRLARREQRLTEPVRLERHQPAVALRDPRRQFTGLRHGISPDRSHCYFAGLSPRINGAGPGASNPRTFTNPACSSQDFISANVNVSPVSVWISMLSAKNRANGGPVRSSLGIISAMAMVPPGAKAAKTLRINSRLRFSPSLCRM